MAATLEIRSLFKRHGSVEALRDVSLEVAGGEAVALVGESGSGKTTLLRCINRLYDADSGSVSIDGSNVASLDPVMVRRSIGYVPQEGGLLPHWTVARNVGLVPWLDGRPSEANTRRALEVAGLEPAKFMDRWPHQLSGGERQRVAIARAVAGGQSLLLLDEPFSALDAITRSDLHAGFARLRKEAGVTVLLVTHDLREAFELADRTVVMRAGKIEQVGSSSALLASPATPYVAELLARARVSGPGPVAGS